MTKTTDFGFFFEDDLTETLAQQEATKESAVKAANQLYDQINSLLINLESNPDKPTINWPDRTKHVAKFREKLLNILLAAGIDR